MKLCKWKICFFLQQEKTKYFFRPLKQSFYIYTLENFYKHNSLFFEECGFVLKCMIEHNLLMSTWKTIQEPSRHSEEEEKKPKKLLVSFCPDADYFSSKSGTNTVPPPKYHEQYWKYKYVICNTPNYTRY